MVAAQGVIDVATKERDELVRKAEGATDLRRKAQQEYEGLKAEFSTKVNFQPRESRKTSCSDLLTGSREE